MSLLHDFFASAVSATPDAPALLSSTSNTSSSSSGANDADAGQICEPQVMSYRELQARVSFLAASLTHLGLPLGLIAIHSSASPDYVVSLLAILSLGCPFVPLDEDTPPKALPTLILALRPSLLLVQRHLYHKEKFPGLTPVVLDLNLLPGLILLHGPPDPLPLPQTLKLAYFMTTSGTTGIPKVVKVPHSCIVPNITSLRAHFQHAWPSSSRTTFFLASPITFDPSIIEIFLAFATSSCLLILPQRSKLVPSTLARALRAANTGILMMTPTLYRRFTEESLEILWRPDSPVRILCFGGEIFPAHQELATWKKWWPPDLALFNLYGTTECSCWATINRVPWTEDLEQLPSEALQHIGTPLEGTTIEVRGEDGNSVVQDGEGELWLGGESRICLVGDENSGLSLRPTGDLVRIQRSTTIQIIGRWDHQVKVFGKRCHLDDLARQLQLLPGVSFAKFCKDPSPEVEESLLTCFVQFSDSTTRPTVTQIWNHLRASLPPFALPGAIYEIREIPVTKNGKIDTLQLWRNSRQKNLLEIATLGPNSTPREITACLITLVADLLGLGPSEVVASKFLLELGGTSIEAALLTNQLFSWIVPPDPSASLTRQRLLTTLLNSSLEEVGQFMAVHPLSGKRELPPESVIIDQAVNPAKRAKSIKGARSSLPVSRAATSVWSVSNAPAVASTISWKLDTGKCIDASPLIATSPDQIRVVVIGSHSGWLKCAALGSGEEIWATKLGGRIESSCAISKCQRYVIVGCYDQTLYTVDLGSGKIEWQFRVGGEIKSSPCVDLETGLVIFGCHDGCVYCVNIEEKSLSWRFKTSAEIVNSSPKMSPFSRLVYIGTLGGDLLAIDPAPDIPDTSRLRWSASIGKPLFSSPAVWTADQKEYVCLGCVDGAVYCLNQTGEKVWKFQTEKPIFSSPCISGTLACMAIGSHDGHIYCLSLQTGQLLWKAPCQSPVYSSPFILTSPIGHGITKTTTLENGLVLGASTQGIVWILDFLNKGSVVASIDLPGEIFSSPVCEVVNDQECQILVGCRNNHLYSLHISREMVTDREE